MKEEFEARQQASSRHNLLIALEEQARRYFAGQPYRLDTLKVEVVEADEPRTLSQQPRLVYQGTAWLVGIDEEDRR